MPKALGRDEAEHAISAQDRVLADLEALLVTRLGRVGRTKLVKLVYLVDERFYSHYGSTLTGHSYIYDDWGPNAVDNAIVKVGDKLHDAGVIERKPDPRASDRGFLYTPGASIEEIGTMSEQGREVVEDILREYGHMNREQITNASKATRPFASGPAKDDRLQMTTLREVAVVALGSLLDEAAVLTASRSADDGAEERGADRPESWIVEAQAGALREALG